MHNLEKFHQRNRQYRGEMKKKGCSNPKVIGMRVADEDAAWLLTKKKKKEDTNIRLKYDRGGVRKKRFEGGTTDMNFWKGLLKQIAKCSPYHHRGVRERQGGGGEGGIEPLNCEAFRLRFYLLSDDAQSSVDARKTNFRQWCNAVWISPSFPSTRSIKKWIVTC